MPQRLLPGIGGRMMMDDLHRAPLLFAKAASHRPPQKAPADAALFGRAVVRLASICPVIPIHVQGICGLLSYSRRRPDIRPSKRKACRPLYRTETRRKDPGSPWKGAPESFFPGPDRISLPLRGAWIKVCDSSALIDKRSAVHLLQQAARPRRANTCAPTA